MAPGSLAKIGPGRHAAVESEWPTDLGTQPLPGLPYHDAGVVRNGCLAGFRSRRRAVHSSPRDGRGSLLHCQPGGPNASDDVPFSRRRPSARMVESGVRGTSRSPSTRRRMGTAVPIRLEAFESGFVVYRKPSATASHSGKNFPQLKTIATLLLRGKWRSTRSGAARPRSR